MTFESYVTKKLDETITTILVEQYPEKKLQLNLPGGKYLF